MEPHHFKRSRLAEFMTFEQYQVIDQRTRRPIPHAIEYSQKVANIKGHNLLTRLVMDAIKSHGGQAEKVITKGWAKPIERRDVLGRLQFVENQYIPTTGRRGSADISATINGRSVKIECKVGRDFQKPDQVAYQREVEEAGGIYVLCRHLDDIWPYICQENPNPGI